MGKLNGKIAVITGGTSGIGLATAQRFAAEGAFVFVTGRRQAELDAAVASLGERGAGFRGDVASLGDLDRLYALVKETKGRIDVLFANAGGGELRPLSEVTEEHYDWIFDLNVKGVVFTVQKALPLLVDGASIILNSSTAGSTGGPAFSIYSATKAAVRSFARTWILDLAPRRIRVNALSPGGTDTPGLDTLAPTDELRAQVRASVVAQIPLGRLATPDEVARAVTFLASDDSAFVNGSELFVDGGSAQI